MAIDKPFLLRNNLRRLVRQVQHEEEHINLFYDYFKLYYKSRKNIAYICKKFMEDPLLTDGEQKFLKERMTFVLERRKNLYKKVEELNSIRSDGLTIADELYRIINSKLE